MDDGGSAVVGDEEDKDNGFAGDGGTGSADGMDERHHFHRCH